MESESSQSFAEEFFQMRERLEWAQAAFKRDHNVAQAKTILSEFREFYGKWHSVIDQRDLRKNLEAAYQHMEKTLGLGMERIFLAHLYEVVEARKDWWTAEQLFKAMISFIALMKEAPPQLRPELEKIHREHMQKEYDPETSYRDAEQDAAEEEAAFRKALAGLEVDWPERVDAAMKARLETLDGTGANAWQAELAEQTSKLTSKT